MYRWTCAEVNWLVLNQAECRWLGWWVGIQWRWDWTVVDYCIMWVIQQKWQWVCHCAGSLSIRGFRVFRILAVYHYVHYVNDGKKLKNILMICISKTSLSKGSKTEIQIPAHVWIKKLYDSSQKFAYKGKEWVKGWSAYNYHFQWSCVGWCC